MSDIDKLRESFVQEASDLLDQIETTCLDLENDPQNEANIKEVYRVVHTLKGSSRMFGFEEVEGYLHVLEDFLNMALKGEVTLQASDINVLFKSMDLTRVLITQPEKAKEKQYIDQKNTVLSDIAELTSQKNVEANQQLKESKAWDIALALDGATLSDSPDPFFFLDELKVLGKASFTFDASHIPALADYEDDTCYGKWKINLLSEADEDAVADVFMFLTDSERVSLKAAELPVDVVDSQIEQQKTSSGSREKSIKVDSSKLDDLLNLVGELVINQARLQNLVSSSEMELLSSVEENERLINTLQEEVMNIRMLPVDSIYLRFRRMVRDIAENLEKKVELTLIGGDTELDKNMLDNLIDPFLHLLRNAIDHGLETPADRLKVGKNEIGHIEMKAMQEAGEFVLRIKDDGRGINTENILSKAKRSGIVTENQKLTESEILQLIFEPGFSTSHKGSNVSGRGMGLDVVKRAIDGMNGSLGVSSKLGEGTEFILRLPLTLAITECLLVSSEKHYYALPVSYIERCDNYNLNGSLLRERPLVKYNEEYVPFVRLRSVFNLDGHPPAMERMVMLRLHGKVLGVLCDTIIGNIQAVMKPLSSMFKQAKVISSSTILPDGSVGLILDASELSRMAAMEEDKYLATTESINAENPNVKDT